MSNNENENVKVENAENVECGITETFIDHVVNNSSVEEFVTWSKEFVCKFLKISEEEFDINFDNYKEDIMQSSNVNAAFIKLCEGFIGDWMNDHSWHSPYQLRTEKIKVWLILGLNYIARNLSELEFAVQFNFFDWRRFVENCNTLTKEEKHEMIESGNCYNPENVFRFIQYAIEEGYVDGDDWGSLKYIANRAQSLMTNFANKVITRHGLMSAGPAICVDIKSNKHNMRHRILIIRSYYTPMNLVADLIVDLNNIAKKMGVDKEYYYIDQKDR